jgi:TonB family protein
MRHLLLLAILALAAAPLASQASDPARLFELAEVDSLPRPLNPEAFREALAAGYPELLRDAGIQGGAVLSFVIGEDGGVREVEVVSATHELFGPPSAEAARVLRFSPAVLGGRPVAVRVQQPVQWAIERAAAAPPAPPRDDAHRYELHAVTDLPRVLNAAEFADLLSRNYPVRVTDQNRTVVVHLRFAVDAEGRVHDVHVIRSTDPRFDAITVRVARQLLFRPAEIHGRPVTVWVEQPIRWPPPPPRPSPPARGRGRPDPGWPRGP